MISPPTPTLRWPIFLSRSDLFLDTPTGALPPVVPCCTVELCKNNQQCVTRTHNISISNVYLDKSTSCMYPPKKKKKKKIKFALERLSDQRIASQCVANNYYYQIQADTQRVYLEYALQSMKRSPQSTSSLSRYARPCITKSIVR